MAVNGSPGGARSEGLRNVVRRLTIRGVLLAGFGLLLVLWVLAGADLLRRLSEVETRATAVNARLIRTEDLLSTISSQVLLGSVYLRDALLDTPDTADYYREQLERSRATIDRALAAYNPAVESRGERSSFDNLKVELQDYWDTVLPLLSWDSGRRAIEARAVLRGRVIPKREVIIRISERIRTLNRAAADERQAEVARIYAVVRRRVWEASLELLLIGGCVAFLVTRHAGRLEHRIVENTRNLQRLSARLVRAQEEERHSIARELHDEIGQELTGVKVELSVVERSLENETRSTRPLADARVMVDRALQTVRDLSQLLHPPMLDDLGLRPTLEWFLVSFSKRTGIAVEFDQDEEDDGRLVPELEMCLYRIVQEATTNIVRHATARACRVSLRRSGANLRLVIEDDGRGFDPAEVLAGGARSGLGLLGMQERVAGFGGTFRVDSAAGHGTRVVADVPRLLRPAPDDVEIHDEAPDAQAPPEGATDVPASARR
jgi:signal transduction histidine kinase